MKILIVSYDWPPRNAIATHRPYSWAKYWSELGAEVTVLTAKKQSFDWPLDLKLEQLNGVNVIEVQYVGFLKRLLLCLLRSEKFRSVARMVKRTASESGGLSLALRDNWHCAAMNSLSKGDMDFDVVVSTFGPSAAHLIANYVKLEKPEIKWIADYRDPWAHNRSLTRNEDSEEQKEARSVKVNSDVITVVSASMAKEFKERGFLQPIYVITNGYDLDFEHLISNIKTRKRPDFPLRIVYTGTIYSGHRDPTPLIESLKQLLDEGFFEEGQVTVDFYGSRLSGIDALSKDPSIRPLVRRMGHVSREEAMEAQKSAHILLLMESRDESSKGVLTGKLFEYACSGTPILCIGSSWSYDIGRFLKLTGTGVVFPGNRGGELRNYIRESISGRGIFEDFKPNPEEIRKYSRKAQAKKMFHEVVKS